MTILLVEDTPDLLLMTKLTLVQMGLKITPAASVLEANLLLDTMTFKGVITDFQLPEVDSNYFKKLSLLSIPTLVLTANPDFAKKKLSEFGLSFPVLDKLSLLQSSLYIKDTFLRGTA